MKAPKIGLLQAMRLCSQYEKMSPAQKQALQQERLQRIVAYAKENSPYYAGLY
ncbi:MAG: hypothetical protein PHO41_01715 [Eubacteriales bacterium]|nr:hypothetical protein [Eubacteriales bacterium]